VAQRTRSTKKIPRRGRRSGKGENIRTQKPLQNNGNILTTIAIISTLITTLRKNDGNYIQR
jgi:hypothetical protein